MILFTNISILGDGVGWGFGVGWGDGDILGNHKGCPYDFQYGVEMVGHYNVFMQLDIVKPFG